MSHGILSRYKNYVWKAEIAPGIIDAYKTIFFINTQTETLQCISKDAATSEILENIVFNRQIITTYSSDSSEGTLVVYSSALMFLGSIQ
jgi:hypothetical protein